MSKEENGNSEKRRRMNRLAKRKSLLRAGGRVCYYLNYFFCRMIQMAGKLMGHGDLSLNLMFGFCEAVEDTSGTYITYSVELGKAKDGNERLSYRSSSLKRCCILVQGPVVKKNHFTLETVRAYKKMFPGVKIIVSLWKGDDEKEIRLLRKEDNCTVIVSKKPLNSGIENINLQSVGCLKGIRKAKESGIEYVFKTRTDMRLLQRGCLEMLVDLVERYPVGPEFCEVQNKRIVTFETRLFVPFLEGGFNYFGHVDDLERFFNYTTDIELSKFETEYGNALKAATYRDIFEHPTADNMLMIEYYRALLDGEISCDLNLWWRVLKNSIIPMTSRDCRYLWYKYEHSREENLWWREYLRWPFDVRGMSDMALTTVDFGIWKDMLIGEFNLRSECYEKLIDTPAIS